MKLCIFVVDLLKICLCIFDGARLNVDRLTAF